MSVMMCCTFLGDVSLTRSVYGDRHTNGRSSFCREVHGQKWPIGVGAGRQTGAATSKQATIPISVHYTSALHTELEVINGCSRAP
jgi:hypothetical protein